ncbi:MAG: hypothetical protein N2513_09660 [Deltaproteobacteria bacterium]|nr:hypothetical protein [Deltaproteobacteria bacterium]
MFPIISCVGTRPLAVINPIYTFIKSYNLALDNVEIILFFTERTQKTSKECENWFEEVFNRIKVRSLPFNKKDISTKINSIAAGKEAIYFNVNPGMNWEVALLTYHLPLDTICFYGDFKYLYVWRLKEDVKKATTIELFSLGWETYNRFSDKVFFKRYGINEGLSENLRDLLRQNNIYEHFEVEIKSRVPGELMSFIKERLVWASERHGNVYLLFDFQFSEELEKLTDDKAKELRKDYNLFYRAITEIFDPLNFDLTFVMDDFFLAERAKVDRYRVILRKKGEEADWKSKVLKWIKNPEFYPKRIMHFDLKKEVSNWFGASVSRKGNLCVCIGDNVSPTLKAILSHNASTIWLFYDKNSTIIKSLAENLKKLFLGKGKIIHTIPTDNKGSGIVDFIKTNLENLKDLQINITPGTKSQTVALVQAAKNIKRPEAVFSIDGEWVRNLVSDDVVCGTISPDPDLVIDSLLLNLKSSLQPPKVEAFSHLMKALSEKKIRGNLSKILDLTIEKRGFFRKKETKVFEIVDFPTDSKTAIIKCTLDNQSYEIDKIIIEDERTGVWWEAAVAYSLEKALNVKVLWGVTWNWPQKSKKTGDQQQESKKTKYFFSELDVVFKYKEYICCVSCKTGSRRLKELTRYEILSEARKRFDRFALPMIALPFDKSGEKKWEGLIEDGVLHITPTLLANEERLKKAIDHFITFKRTTRSPHLL